MNISKQEIEKENQYLSDVKKVINDYISKIDIKIKKEKKEIMEIKKYIWSECKSLSELEYGNLLNDTDYQVKRTNDQIQKAYIYTKMLNSPYFGKIDFITEEEKIDVYIGMNGLHTTSKNYIFDWRAPISSLFYGYTVGNAQYEAPMGTVKGEIISRRQYKIEEGKLKRIIETDMNIDDEILQEVLSSNSTDKMKNIVTTIQKEQNAVIRNVSDKYLIVQGVAGSGKTSVALHRIAYLLYREKNLNYNNILIFSPNEIFSEYISDVLPELGEQNVLNTTFEELVKTYIKKYKNIETFSEFLERKYESKENGNNFLTKEQLNKIIKKYINNHTFKQSITINGITFNTFELNDLLIHKYKKFPLSERVTIIAEDLCRNSNVPIRSYKNKVRTQILKVANMKLDAILIYKEMLNKDLKKIYYEDLINIIYIFFELNGYPYNTKVKHVVIDEAQDYLKLQFYILKKIFPYAYFTILGDINQSINPNCEYNSLNELNSIFDNNSKYIELNKTYRSSGEIISYANKLIGMDNITSARGNNGIEIKFRNGNENAKQLILDLKELMENGMKTIAIITKNAKETSKIYNYLIKLNTDISFIKNKIKKDSVSILPSYIAKGLEFDGVILYTNSKNKYTKEEQKLYYVVCTRAQHQLIVYNNTSIF